MTEVIAVLVLTLLAVGILVAMRRGWVHRRDADAAALPEPPVVPTDDVLGAPLTDPVEATYVSTTRATDAFARVAAHGLGARSAATVRVHRSGLVVRRTGAPDLFVPAASTTVVGTSPGMVGKVVGGEGLLVVEWRLGEEAVRTGLRTRRRADQAVLARALHDLTDPGGHPGDPSRPSHPGNPDHTTPQEEQR